MKVITWESGPPKSQGEPAAKGTFLNALIEVKIFWMNLKGYFEVTFAGNNNLTFPEHLDNLEAAKNYAERMAAIMLLNATEILRDNTHQAEPASSL